MFYYDAYWSQWDRRLLTMSGYVLDISLTSEWETVREERIRLHRTVDRTITLVPELPPDVVARMTDRLGPELTGRLTTFNYVGHYGLRNIVAADLQHPEGGGVPAASIEPRKKERVAS